jgi:site-specific DNA recombinase
MKKYLAYIRVSTVKQGEHGSSLQEQKSAIEAYAARQTLIIGDWFEEVETAAKQGRPMFTSMLTELRKGRAEGVIIHKIDRSARNLKDWALIGDLIDQGVEIHFAHESLDMTSRGGRLAADIQAVVASDYIRNLRDEVKKGFYGRLKQGFYPLPAPRGYLDRGKAKAKEIDPDEGPLVCQAFELYGTGTYSLDTLRTEMHRRGLRSRSGAPLNIQALAGILHNPFYVGIIHIKRTNEMFEGVHAPIVTKAQFERVQAIMSGRVFARAQVHDFAFRRFVRCRGCTRTLTGEHQKGHTYYRCHGPECRGTSFTDEQLDGFVCEQLALLHLDDGDVGDFRDFVRTLIDEERAGDAERTQHVSRDLALLDDRMRRLTDAYLDGSIDKAAHNERRAALLMERRSLRDVQSNATGKLFWETVLEKFERGNVAQALYISAIGTEKRELLKSIGSNLVATRKSIDFTMDFPFSAIRDWHISSHGGPHHAHLRKADRSSRGGKCKSRNVGELVKALQARQAEL